VDSVSYASSVWLVATIFHYCFGDDQMLKKRKAKTSAVDVKLQLPKDLNFKILAQLYKDLGCSQEVNAAEFVNDLSDDEEISSFGKAIRQRDTAKLLSAAQSFQPQSMLYDGLHTSDFYVRYQLGSFLKKYPEKGDDSKKRAIAKFHSADRECGLYNETNHRALLALDEKHPSFLGVIQEIQHDILGLLDDFPNVDRLLSLSKHGPGTSLLGKLYANGKTTCFYKWSTLPYTVTPQCVPYAKTAISSDPRWIGALDDEYRRSAKIPLGSPIDTKAFWAHVLKTVECSRTTTVPKSAEIDRTICIEPLLNVYLQLGVDGLIRSRLKSRWQYNIDDQSKNQELAQRGSADGDFATVDLSSASDLISLKICEILLPPAWYDLLLDLRSAATEIDGQIFPLSKISSMGNGYTFALETLIFGALTRCAIRRTKSPRISSVYGDDIVLPTCAYVYLKELLTMCGFRLNTAKTFTDGPFRESCGKDFYKGMNVRPLFLSKEIKTLPDLLYVHNAIWALEHRLDWTFGFDFTETRLLIRKYIPPKIRKACYGPASESLDTYLFSGRKLPRTSGGYRWGMRVIPQPITGKRRYKDFFFIKLMCNLRGDKPSEHSWDVLKKPNTGNAFDITKRGFVKYKLTKCKVWE